MRVDQTITVLYAPDDITLMYSLYPLLMQAKGSLFRYVKDPMVVLDKPVSRIILIMRYQKIRKSLTDEGAFLRRLRDTYERVVYFDDTAMPFRFNSDFLELADLYYKKQLPADRELLFKPVHSGRLFSHYYSEVLGVSDTPMTEPVSLKSRKYLSKIRLSWSLGIGSYPRSMPRKLLARRIEETLGPKAAKLFYHGAPRGRCPKPRGNLISARFATAFDSQTVTHHRTLFERAVQDLPNVKVGKTRLREYNAELRRSIVTISPFGWGEVCFRDFEAMVYGSLLVKPSMTHIDTWPQTYLENSTYLSVQWDASDVAEKVSAIVENEQRRAEITEAAYDTLSDAYADVPGRVDSFISELLG